MANTRRVSVSVRRMKVRRTREQFGVCVEAFYDARREDRAECQCVQMHASTTTLRHSASDPEQSRAGSD